MMATVKANYEFIKVEVGTNGRASDGGVFTRSKFYDKLKNNDLSIPKLPLSDQEMPYCASSTIPEALSKLQKNSSTVQFPEYLICSPKNTITRNEVTVQVLTVTFLPKIFDFSVMSNESERLLGRLSTLVNYLRNVQRLYSACDGDTLAASMSLRDKHIMNLNLYIQSPENAVDRILDAPIDEVFTEHLKDLYYLGLEPREFEQAYRHQSQCVQSVVKMLQQLKEENWFLPIMYTACIDLRILAQKLGDNNKPGENWETTADCLMSCFRICADDNRSLKGNTKRLGMLNLVNQLFKVYFRMNKFDLCKPLIRAIESSPFKDAFPLPERITYTYFVGRQAMFESDYKSADEFLSFALCNCPRNFPHNKRLILIYLVPVKMLLGYLPTKQVLEHFDLLQFHELTIALKEGNVRKFDEVIKRHEIFFIKFEINLLVENLKFILYRNLFKRVFLIKQTHQLDLSAFRAALQFVGEPDISIDETHCIVANLIFQRKIKGYISYSHNILVVSKQNPFPSLNSIS